MSIVKVDTSERRKELLTLLQLGPKKKKKSRQLVYTCLGISLLKLFSAP